MTLCDTFKRMAIDTWDQISLSRQVNHQLKEETLTDLNILNFLNRHQGQVHTKVFTKAEEGKLGADWEWWFKSLRNRWIGVRIQAKIINISTDTFEHLHYHKYNKYQSDKLIQNALGTKIPTIPLYCLYTHTSSAHTLPNWPCRSFPSLVDLFGCSLVSAFQITQHRPKRDLATIEKLMRPWHCMVCCPVGGTTDLTHNIQSYLEANLEIQADAAHTIARERNVNIPRDFSTEQPPDYVKQILRNSLTADTVMPPDSDLAGLIIYEEIPKG